MYKICAILFLFDASFLCLTLESKVENQTLLHTNVTTTNTSLVQIESKTPGQSTDQVSVAPLNGREGVVVAQVTHTVSSEEPNKTTTEVPKVQSVNATIISHNETAIKNISMITKPVTEAPSKISPRKGVTLPESLKSPQTGAAAPVVKKPTITENTDDDYKPSDAQSIKNNINVLVPDSKEHKRAAYLIPIIAVIFSVPLVAAIISVLYKRGSEWWQHRHYRRMDFLIEGMYNN